MKPYYEDSHIKIFNKDCRSMDELSDESVQMVCTSPPFWGLRKYSGDQDLIWGGDNHCEHEWNAILKHRSVGGPQIPQSKWTSNISVAEAQRDTESNFCSLCGAWKGAYGLEPTPDIYIQHTIEILREIRRVLRKDGVVFWNIGDSYWGGKGQSGYELPHEAEERHKRGETLQKPYQVPGYMNMRPSDGRHSIIKPKDLCLIPFRIAIAAQEDGWWVRSVIIWSKPNPMPESVKDRPTESHEYILMLTKSGTPQYWTHPRKRGSRTQPKPDYIWTHKRTGLVVDYQPVSSRIVKEFWARRNLWQGHDYYWDQEAVREPSTERPSGNISRRENFQPRESHFGTSIPYQPNGTGRNIRSVWQFPTVPFPGIRINGRKVSPFAVFPEKLPELCIKAATPEVGCCSNCGAPSVRITKPHRPDDYDPSVVDEKYAEQARKSSGHAGTNRPLSKIFKDSLGSSIETLGWKPTCKCNASRVPSTVLDPFMGAGTTLLVAKNLNRLAVGYELSEEYCQLAVERCRQQVLV